MPEELSMRIIDWLYAAVAGLIAWAWKEQGAKVESLRKEHESKFDNFHLELNRQRDVSAKIFDKLEEHARRSEERHIEMIQIMHEGLARKVDK